MTETPSRIISLNQPVLAVLRRLDRPSFLVALADGAILAATDACAALGLLAGDRAPPAVMAIARTLAAARLGHARQERVRLPGIFVPHLFLCAPLSLPAGAVVLFADPEAMAAEAEAAPPAPASGGPGAIAIPAELRGDLPRAVRFTWESDAAGRLTGLSPQAEAAFAAGWAGQTFADLEEQGRIDDAGPLLAALDGAGSFAGVRVRTRTETTFLLEMGGVPLIDSTRRRMGTRGFGRAEPMPGARPAAPGPEAPGMEGPPADGTAPPGLAGDNVVPLRAGNLSAKERSAFHEIARTLNAAIEDWPRPREPDSPPDPEEPGGPQDLGAPETAEPATAAAPAPPSPADPAPPVAASALPAVEPASAPPAMQQQPVLPRPVPPGDGLVLRDDAALLDQLPVALLVQQDGRIAHANRTFLLWAGYEDTAAFREAGSLASHLERPVPDGALQLRTAAGSRIAVEDRVVKADYRGRPALVHLLRRLEPGPPPADPIQLQELRARGRREALDLIPLPVLLVEADGAIRTANAAAAARSGFRADELVGEPFTVLLAPESHEDAVRLLDGADGTDSLHAARVMLRDRHGRAAEAEALVGPADGHGDLFCLVLAPPLPVAAPPPLAPAETGGTIAPDGATQAADLAIAALARRAAEGLARPLQEAMAALRATRLPAADVAVRIIWNTLRDLEAMGDAVPAGPAEPFDLTPVVSRVLDAAESRARRLRVVLRRDLAATAPCRAGHGGREAAARLVRRLVEEALAASPAGGQVVVSLAVPAGPEGPPLALLTVADSGEALDEVALARALEPARPIEGSDRFSQAGRPLRLAAIAAMARAMGGSLDLRPGDGVGLTVQARLPL